MPQVAGRTHGECRGKWAQRPGDVLDGELNTVRVTERQERRRGKQRVSRTLTMHI
jgi:hypothetical protein